MVLGDLDADGDLDGWTIGRGIGSLKEDYVWINDGGMLALPSAAATLPNIGDQRDQGSLALGVVDGDGDLDALVGSRRQSQPAAADRLWLNDGCGSFQESLQSFNGATEQTDEVALADPDGDGDLDVFFAWQGALGSGRHVWLNQGDGTFLEGYALLGSREREAGDVALGDLDGDGALDAYVTTGSAVYPAEPDAVYLPEPSVPLLLAALMLGAEASQSSRTARRRGLPGHRR